MVIIPFCTVLSLYFLKCKRGSGIEGVFLSYRYGAFAQELGGEASADPADRKLNMNQQGLAQDCCGSQAATAVKFVSFQK